VKSIDAQIRLDDFVCHGLIDELIIDQTLHNQLLFCTLGILQMNYLGQFVCMKFKTLLILNRSCMDVEFVSD
jgi:hypothetical protein